MESQCNFPITGANGRPIVADLRYARTGLAQPLVIFLHGYKGFKDWGVFAHMDAALLSAGFAVMKFNFSHNGGTLAEPIDFPDLEAFGLNNYSKELDDVQAVLNWVESAAEHHVEVDARDISLIGHSRGGAIATLTAAGDSRVRKLVTWAAVSTLDRSMFHAGPELDAWKSAGVLHVRNGRTGQDMPHGIQFYEDFVQNRARFDVARAARALTIPHLVVHGDGDTSVPFSHAEALAEWSTRARLLRVAGADHVFGGQHPWEEPELPADFQSVLAETVLFLQELNP